MVVDEPIIRPMVYFNRCQVDEPPPVKGQDQTVQLGNSCYSSTSEVTTDEVHPAIMFVFVFVFFVCVLCVIGLRVLLIKKTWSCLRQVCRF